MGRLRGGGGTLNRRDLKGQSHHSTKSSSGRKPHPSPRALRGGAGRSPWGAAADLPVPVGDASGSRQAPGTRPGVCVCVSAGVSVRVCVRVGVRVLPVRACAPLGRHQAASPRQRGGCSSGLGRGEKRGCWRIFPELGVLRPSWSCPAEAGQGWGGGNRVGSAGEGMKGADSFPLLLSLPGWRMKSTTRTGTLCRTSPTTTSPWG